MQREINSRIDSLYKLDANWQNIVNDYLKDQESVQPGEDLLQTFFELLSLIYKGLKEGKIERETTLSAFNNVELREQVQRMVDNRLKSFTAFTPLRIIETENILQIERFIDNIWVQYVLRFNPKIKTENDFNLNAEQVNELMSVIDGLAMHSVSRLLTYDGIEELISERTGMGEEFCSYLARKIDKDFNELRLNYIISKLRD